MAPKEESHVPDNREINQVLSEVESFNLFYFFFHL